MFFYGFMSALLHHSAIRFFICSRQIKAKDKQRKDSMRLCIMLILNSCPEQGVCVHVRASASAYLGKFQLSPRDLHSRSSSALRTSASSRRAATVSSGDTTLGGISAGYRGVTCGWRTPRKVSAKKIAAAQKNKKTKTKDRQSRRRSPWPEC